MAKNQTLVIVPNFAKDRRLNCHQKGVVFLLGWVGSNFRHLYSFAQIYEHVGISSIMYCFSPNTFHSVFPRSTVSLHARYLLKELYDKKMDEIPVFFHIFSNGGSIMYYSLLKELQKPPHQHIKISGVVFDSCPSNFVTSSAASAYLKVMAVDRSYLTNFLGNFFCAVAYLNMGLNKCIDFVTGEKEGLEKLYFARNTLTQSTRLNFNYPHCFMYSKTDRIVLWDEIEKFAEDRKKQGIKVITNRWENTDHCNHRIIYPKEYADTLRKFILEDCFKELPPKKEKKEDDTSSYRITGYTSIRASGITSKL